MDLWPLKALNYGAHLAEILPENTLIYSSYICEELRFYVEVKIVFEAHKEPALFSTFFTYFDL